MLYCSWFILYLAVHNPVTRYMRKSLLLFCFLISFAGFKARAQYTISGKVTDTVNLAATQFTSVSLLRASDSMLQAFTRANEQGDFLLQTDTTGKYLILIAHPSFLTYIDLVDVQQTSTSLGHIALLSRKQLLQEVVITDARAIVIKGDTIEYAADSFKTRVFDNVDELLKKLPGLEIGRDGKIKAYGEEVKKMLVDGEEFFSDDPAIVAQTLRAASVDKVQVFDKKSDQAAFTGIDDGERIKTINLKLKDNAKQGYFGKVSGGAGPPGYWENQAMINAFKGKRKIAVYGLMSNTSTNGLDWNDQRKYGDGGDMNFDEESGGFFVSGDGSDFDGEGLPKSWTGGGHYSNKWMGDSLSFNGNYKYAKAIAESENNSMTRYILPDTQYINTVNSAKTSIGQKHKINTTTEYQIDSTSSLKLKLGGNYGKTQTGSRYVSKAESAAGGLINDNVRLQQSESEDKGLSASLLYRKRFRKKGRTFSANFTGNLNEQHSNSILQSKINLYAINSTDSLNQNKVNDNKTLTGNLKLTYSEPLSKIASLELNYGLNINNNNADNRTMDRDGAGGSDVINPDFSSHYIFNVATNQGGASVRFNFKKINFSFGGNIADTRFKQDDLMYDTSYSYHYVNFFPRVSFMFSKSQQSSLRFNYSGRTQQPTMEQLQPLRNNTDPLNIAIGNPDLKQAFKHTFDLDYNSYKVMSGTSIYLSGYFNIIQNAISQQQDVDISGKRTYRYVNVDGNFGSGLYGYYGFKKIGNLHPGLGLNMSYDRFNNFINGLANRNNNLEGGPDFSFRYDKDTTFDISYNFNPAYHLNRSSIREDIRTEYWTFEQRLDGNLNLPLGIKLGTSVTWNIRQRLDPAERNNNVFRWNAYISKAMLKDRSLVAKCYVNDILDQNIGYNRTTNAEYIAENTYNTIRRYFLFSLTWNFTKTGARAPASEGFEISE